MSKDVPIRLTPTGVINDNNATTANQSSKRFSNEEDDDENSKKATLKIVTDLVDQVFDEDIFSMGEKELPRIWRTESTIQTEISHQEFRNMILKKSADIIINNSDIGKKYFIQKKILENTKKWEANVKNLLLEIRSVRGMVEVLPREEPTESVINVRNVGIQVDLSSHATLKPLIDPDVIILD